MTFKMEQNNHDKTIKFNQFCESLYIFKNLINVWYEKDYSVIKAPCSIVNSV